MKRLAAVLWLGAAALVHGGTLFLGTWPHHVVVLDEATQAVTDRIDIGNDVPMQLLMSEDHKRVYAFTPRASGVVTIDVAARKVIDSFSLDAGGKQYRLAGGAISSDGKLLYSIVIPTVKKIDRFEREPAEFVVVDLSTHAIVRTSPFPKDQDLYGLGGLYVMCGFRLSPDNKYLYTFRQNIEIFQTSDFKLVDTIDLAKPAYPGFQTVSLNLVDNPNEAPGKVTSLFVASDPVVHQPVFGIANIDLETRNIDFTPVGPSTTHTMALWLTPDRSRGYTVSMSGQNGNKRSEFWVFDMKSKKLVEKAEFEGRRRFDMALSPSGNSIYIYIAGFEVACYDAKTLKLTKTIDLNADTTSNMVMTPGA